MILSASGVHVWFLFTDGLDNRMLARWYRWLSPAERERHRRLRFERDRRQSLAARALLRLTLSRYTDVEPGAWTFVEGAHGKPAIAPPPDPPAPPDLSVPLDLSVRPDLRFNLSHTHGLVACVVAHEMEVGIDVEWLDRPQTGLDVARRVFAPTEMAQLEPLSGADRQARFYELWTLKEAYIKARGLGLSLPLDRFAFDLAAWRDAGVRFSPPPDDRARVWEFRLAEPGPRHRLAVAVEKPGPGDLEIVMNAFEPGAG